MRSGSVRCPECDAPLTATSLPPALARVKCPSCGAVVRVPSEGPIPTVTPAHDPYEEHDDGPRRRRPKQPSRSGGGKVAAILAAVVLGSVFLVCAGVGVFVAYWMGPEDSPSPVELRQARAGFQTRVTPNPDFVADGPAPVPPPNVYRVVRYPSPAGNLVAYLTPDPGDGRRRPAVVWAHGGFGGIGEDAWEPGGDTDAFRRAGFVVLCPSWRGENDNPGRYEMFYGEVEDAAAAVEYVAGLPYVDRQRVYLAGHSTGGTVTLLTALWSDKVRAAFSFGGAPDMYTILRFGGIGYGNTPFDWRDKKERRLRSAIGFVAHLRTPTFYFEGAEDSDYLDDARKMEQLARKAGVPFTAHLIEGGDHFDVVVPVTELIARKIAADTGPACNIAVSDAEVRQAFAPGGMPR